MVKDSSSMGSLTLSRYTRIPPPLWLYYIHRLLIHGLSQSIPVFIATSSMVLYIGCSSMVSNTLSRYTRLPPLWLKTAHPWVHSLFPGITATSSMFLYIGCSSMGSLTLSKVTSSMVKDSSPMGSLTLSRYTRLPPLWLYT